MNMTTFIDRFLDNQNQHPWWRYGQALFNTLHGCNPELAEQIRGTEADPFYADNPSDERVSEFWKVMYDYALKTSQPKDQQ